MNKKEETTKFLNLIKNPLFLIYTLSIMVITIASTELVNILFPPNYVTVLHAFNMPFYFLFGAIGVIYSIKKYIKK